MSPTYLYQESAVLTEISPDLIQTAALDDPIFKLFPIVKRNAAKLRWKIRDKMAGAMRLRGLGGEPTRINRVGTNILEANPGAYGEYETIDEVEMTNRAANVPANTDVPIDVQDLVDEAQEVLTYRQAVRMKMQAWILAIYNTYTAALPTGGIGHAESYVGQQVTVSPLWSDAANSTPLKNMRSLQPTFGFGTSNQFGGMAEAWMNTITANYLLGNTNVADLGGKRITAGNTINDLDGINKILLDNNLPQIRIWDDGYYDDNGNFQLYIPTGKVLVAAKRPDGETPGEFQWTRNVNNPNAAPEPYAFVDDRTSGPTKTVPPRIDVHQGFNGGAVCERPSQLVTLTVA